jgi:predicted transposase YbfD/YdcC
MVSAWGCQQRLVLAQIATDAKSNEITAVPKPGSPATGLRRWGGNRGPQRQVFVAGVETGVPSDRSSSLGWKLLALLTLKGTIVTADALNCQRSIAQQIVDQKGDYALALKGNQGTLHDDVVLLLDDPECAANTAAPVVEGDHGRIETRTATVSTEIGWLQKQHQWPGLKAIGKIVRVRQTAEQTTTETAYYLLSATLTPERFNEVHWRSPALGRGKLACTGVWTWCPERRANAS